MELLKVAQTVIIGFGNFFIMSVDRSIEELVNQVSLTSIKVTVAIDILNGNQWVFT